MINIFKATTKTGFAVSLVFQITQHSRDRTLMESFISLLNCGRYVTRSNNHYGDFLVTNFPDNRDKIIPLFQNDAIKGTKAKDFADFCKAASPLRRRGDAAPPRGGQLKLLKLKVI